MIASSAMRATAILLVVMSCCTPESRLTSETHVSRGPDSVDDLRASEARTHGWELWRAITQRAGTSYVWETWPRSDVAFGKPDRRFRTLVPFRGVDRMETEQLPVMFAVAFDPTAAAHVAALGGTAGLVALRGLGAPVPEFPRTAIALKLVWYPIHAHGLTAMPIWDAAPSHPSAVGNPDTTWRRAIAVDPGNSTSGEATVTLRGTHYVARVVPLASFMHAVLSTDADVVAARTAARDSTLARGDFVALVAMHVTTKELPDWMWATYWWHDRDDGRFARDRPRDLVGPASHYLMDVTLDAATPSFNPWLEARFPDGLDSNCVSCHQRAAFGATEYLPVTRGTTSPDDDYFDGRLATDFIWSLALESR